VGEGEEVELPPPPMPSGAYSEVDGVLVINLKGFVLENLVHPPLFPSQPKLVAPLPPDPIVIV
jgi:hypothetical protein